MEMKVDVLSVDGNKTGELELPLEVFGVEGHDHAMYLDVRSYLAAQRQGTHKTKERGEVSGGGRKPWKQKGRGTARAGTTRSPLWVGGGRVHGPRPHKYSVGVPKKVKRLARKSAWSLRAKENNVVVVEDIALDAVKTSAMAGIMKALNLSGQKVLQVLPADTKNVYLSSRNIKGLETKTASTVSTYDILNHKTILLHKSAVDVIVKTFGK